MSRSRGRHGDGVAQGGGEAVAYPCEPSFDGVRACVALIDAELPGVTGLIVHNEAALAPLVSVLTATGREVPQEVSIVAVCPEDVALGLAVRLTSIDIPARQVGALAVEMVMRLLEDPSIVETGLPAPTLTRRESSGPPPRVR